MKAFRSIAMGVALSAALIAGSAKPAHAGACETLVCMSGLVGNGVAAGGCSAPIAKYFSIIRFGFWGYSPSLTRTARERYLKSCAGSTANLQWVEAIQAVYGTVP